MQQPGLHQGQRLYGWRNLQQRKCYLQVCLRVCRPHMRHLARALQRHGAPQQQCLAGDFLLQLRRCGQTGRLL